MCFFIFTMEGEKPMDEIESIENKDPETCEKREENKEETQMYRASLLFF